LSQFVATKKKKKKLSQGRVHVSNEVSVVVLAHYLPHDHGSPVDQFSHRDESRHSVYFRLLAIRCAAYKWIEVYIF